MAQIGACGMSYKEAITPSQTLSSRFYSSTVAGYGLEIVWSRVTIAEWEGPVPEVGLDLPDTNMSCMYFLYHHDRDTRPRLQSFKLQSFKLHPSSITAIGDVDSSPEAN